MVAPMPPPAAVPPLAAAPAAVGIPPQPSQAAIDFAAAITAGQQLPLSAALLQLLSMPLAAAAGRSSGSTRIKYSAFDKKLTGTLGYKEWAVFRDAVEMWAREAGLTGSSDPAIYQHLMYLCEPDSPAFLYAKSNVTEMVAREQASNPQLDLTTAWWRHMAERFGKLSQRDLDDFQHMQQGSRSLSHYHADFKRLHSLPAYKAYFPDEAAYRAFVVGLPDGRRAAILTEVRRIMRAAKDAFRNISYLDALELYIRDLDSDPVADLMDSRRHMRATTAADAEQPAPSRTGPASKSIGSWLSSYPCPQHDGRHALADCPDLRATTTVTAAATASTPPPDSWEPDYNSSRGRLSAETRDGAPRRPLCKVCTRHLPDDAPPRYHYPDDCWIQHPEKVRDDRMRADMEVLHKKWRKDTGGPDASSASTLGEAATKPASQQQQPQRKGTYANATTAAEGGSDEEFINPFHLMATLLAEGGTNAGPVPVMPPPLKQGMASASDKPAATFTLAQGSAAAAVANAEPLPSGNNQPLAAHRHRFTAGQHMPRPFEPPQTTELPARAFALSRSADARRASNSQHKFRLRIDRELLDAASARGLVFDVAICPPSSEATA